MSNGRIPEMPEGAQASQTQWEEFFELFGHARLRGAVRLMSRLPAAPRCEACGSPFGGLGGSVMRRMGKAPSRKNPRWCGRCFEHAPDGGATLNLGAMFVDVRNSTVLGERIAPESFAATMNCFYADVTRVVVQHGIVDKLIGDEVMGLYLPPMCDSGRYVDAMVSDALDIVQATTDRGSDGSGLEIGIGLALGPAFVGMVGDGDVRDFTALGDVVNTAARLQTAARPGQIVMTAEVATMAGVDDGEAIEVDAKGKAQPVSARVISASP